MDKIIEAVGLPAVLEQTAEECSELAHACLKLARKIRGENYTPVTLETSIDNFNEEVADVLLCLDKLIESGLLTTVENIEDVYYKKNERWEQRVAIDDSFNAEDIKNY